MKTSIMKWLFGVSLAVAVCGTQLAAAPKAEKLIKLPRGHVEAVDITNLSFTVQIRRTNLTVRYTSETRFFLYGKPAISKDLEVADHVSGILRETSKGHPEAVRIHIEKLAPK